MKQLARFFNTHFIIFAQHVANVQKKENTKIMKQKREPGMNI
jgi:hypothetical protein